MSVVVTLSGPGKLVTIEDSSVSTSSESKTVSALNGYIVCDGPEDITFTATDTDDNTQSFTLKQGEVNSVPFLFKSLSWVTASGTSAFRMCGLQLSRKPGG